LGVCWSQGLGVPANNERAAKLWRAAADKGNARAQFMLGLVYMNGYGVPKSEEEGKKWLRMAAEQGNTEAAKELEKLGNPETSANQSDKAPVAARPASAARPTPKLAETTGRNMTLAEYSSAIDANLKRNILMSQAGQYVGAALSLVAQGRGGENLARRLGIELSGRDEYEIDAILRRRGLGDVENILGGMSEEEIAAISINGYPYIDRLKFWRAATMEYFGGYPLFMEATAGYRRGRRPLPANLGNAEMEEILGSLGIARGNRLDDAQKEFAKFASHFDLDNREDREAFAQALVAGCVAMQERNLALQRGMSADEVFRRIKDIAAILAAEAGMPEAAIVRPAAADSASAGATGRAGNPGQGASRGGAGTPAPAASLSAALEAAKKAPTQENFERVEALWNGLPEERKTALQACVMGAFCAMLLEKEDISEMAKRMKYVDFQALRKAVSETCQACGGTGRVKEKCPKCGGSGKCPGCHGSGAIGGLYGNKIACPKCKSSGRCPACTGGEKEAKCRACTGSGRVQSNAKCRKAMEENLAEALRICRKEGL
ncbi:MAG: SEL1-like repeat protein, partial [Kiritimatiellae bacterium]|nr:SEL1-like repeat protein [Kiritimatiellia bacterium]